MFNQLSIWLSFQLTVVFILGMPLSLLIWSAFKKNKPVNKLLINYWKISVLFFISLFLFIGKQSFALLIINIANILMATSVWFWTDINDELMEYKFLNPLVLTTKVWRWCLTFITFNFLIQSIDQKNCLISINSEGCQTCIYTKKNLYSILKNLFNFLFGANFSEPIAKFFGLFGLLLYTLGLLEWLISKFPKTGRNSNFSNYE